jgi:hypothetical protein
MPSPPAGRNPVGSRLPFATRLKRLLIGPPRDLADQTLFHRISLIPFLAWVGLGADGLSSSAYGPETAFLELGQHTYLAIGLAALMALTVFIISAGYSRIIEEFPHGGGGYVVATRLLGERVGVVSGCALLVDYVLTITVSIAAAGDALFSFLPPEWAAAKLPSEVIFILGLTTLNIRGVRESVLVLAPIFVLFLITHAALIVGGILVKAPQVTATVESIHSGFRSGIASLGMGYMLLLFVRAFSLGGGTYTGIEAVSNGLPIMREPRVQTAKRTMVYMATSLAFTASGLLVSYLLWNITAAPGKTMNAVLIERLVGGVPGGALIVIITLLAEGALLVVAAQAGFIDGPRVLANMAIDSWMPRRFSALSERLTTQNGILLMGGAALAGLLYTRGEVQQIVVMYSINVFLTFSLSLFGMARSWFRTRRERPRWLGRTALFTSGFVLCATILAVTVFEKFLQGGWITLAVTGGLVALCFAIRRHYREVSEKLEDLYQSLVAIPHGDTGSVPPVNPRLTTAAVLVASYGGLGIHTVLNVLRMFPGHYQNLLFLSVGVINSGVFKGEEMEALKARTEETLRRYLGLAAGLGIPAAYRLGLGTDVVEEAETLCLQAGRDFPRIAYFTGKIIFREQRWYQRFLHNQTAFALQKRLQADDRTLVIIPARVQ